MLLQDAEHDYVEISTIKKPFKKQIKETIIHATKHIVKNASTGFVTSIFIYFGLAFALKLVPLGNITIHIA